MQNTSKSSFDLLQISVTFLDIFYNFRDIRSPVSVNLTNATRLSRIKMLSTIGVSR